MSKSFWGYAGAAVAAYFGQWQIAASLLAQGVGAERQRKARNQAREADNAGLQDCMVMADLQPDAPRTLVLGRVRAVEGVRRRWASGTHNENLTLIVSFAGHEIDAFETFWFNDLPLRLDVDGYVETPAQLTGCSAVRSGTTAILTKTGHGIADGERVLIAGFSLPEFNGTFTVFNSAADTFSYAIANAGSGDPPGTPGTVNVLSPYTLTENVTHYLTGTLDGSGEASVTLTSTPIGGTVSAMWSTGTGDASEQGPVTITQDAGLDYDLTGGRLDAGYQVSWQTVEITPMARIRTYLGTDAQSVGTDLAAEYPGHLTATDDFAGIALAVIDLTYSEDAYPQGIPNITATMRGAKCFDPRDDSTAWTENPALHALHYATWDHGWRVPIGEIREQDVIDAANFCDTSTTFTLGADDYTLERYRCGIVISSAADPRSAMGDIMETMAGRWGWAGGTLRMRCGRMATPAFALDETWVAQQVGQGGQASAGPVVRISNGVPREERVNSVAGTCIDPAQRYQALPYPTVSDDVLIAADGAEYRLEADLPGVNHIAHAQHLASITIREGQAPLRMEIMSNLSAYRCELFDVGEVTLARYGMTDKTQEVIGWRWRPAEGVQLRLAEITDEMFTPVDTLNGRDPAPNGNLPSPWYVAPVTGVDVDSDAEIQPDGAVLTLTVVTWDAIVSQAVLTGGRIEVQFTRANAIPATGDWPSWIEQGGATSATIPGLKAQAFYLFRVRAINALGVRGPWSAQVLHLVDGDTGAPDNVAALAYAIKPGQVAVTWAASTALDYVATELRVGASWAAGTFLWRGAGTEYQHPRPDNGTYTVWAAHVDSSGNYSATPASLSVTVDDSIDPASGESVYVEYSIDGSTSWHSTFTTGDLWARWKIGLAGAWGDPFKIVGEDGSAGDYIDFIFKRAASLPSTPTGDTPAGWSDAPPAANGNPLWASTGTKTPAGTLVGVWSTPVQIEGDAGTPGQNSAIVYAYRRNATAPGGPSLTCTYTFSTKTLTGLNNSWTTTVPAGTDTLWVIAATAADTDDSDTIASTDWSTPQQLSGNDGGDGLNSATVWLFQRTGSATAPSLPGSTLTYTFSTSVLSGTLGSWTQAVPAPAGGAYLHVTTATAVSSGATDTIASGEWAAVRLLSQDGTGGTDGLRGSLKGYAYGQYGISDSSWSDGHANRTINNMLTGATLTSTLATTSHLRIGDTVIEGNGTTWSQEKFWSGSAWLLPGTVIDGNLLVTGTISGGVNINITGYGKFEGSAAYTVPYYGGSISVDVALAAGTAATPASEVGVYGRTIVSSGAGVMGINTNTSSGDGVYGEGDTGVTGYANSSNATGVRGYGNASALSYAVRASANNTVSGSRGLWADASAAGQIAAYLESTSGTALQVVGTSTFSKQITSTLATGTAPFAVSSTTENANLNAALLKGKTWAAPDPIGATTPSTGRFTTLRVDATPTASGAAVATFSGLLPTGSAASTNSWAPINFNGTQYWVPVWVD